VGGVYLCKETQPAHEQIERSPNRAINFGISNVEEQKYVSGNELTDCASLLAQHRQKPRLKLLK
jgi:hypothetical protein